MNQTRRWLAGLLCAIMVVCLLPATALADETLSDGTSVTSQDAITRAQLAEMIYNKFYSAKPATDQGFTDIGTEEDSQDDPCTDLQWKAINVLAEEKIISGTGENKFNPKGTVTRGEVTVVIWRATGSKSNPTAATVPFTDVYATDWYAPAIAALVAAGIITGTGGGTFSPNENATVQAVSTLLSQYQENGFNGFSNAATRLEMVMDAYNKYKDSPLEELVDYNIPAPFADISGCTSEETKAIQFFNQLGIVNGYKPANEGDSRFGPYDPASNLQVVMFLYRCAMKFDPETYAVQSSLTRGDTLSTQVVSYALSVPDGAQETVNAAWVFFGLTTEDALRTNANAPAVSTTIDTLTGAIQTPAAPTFTPDSGTQPTSVTLSADEGAVIYYTIATSGSTPSDPTVNSIRYTTSISVGQTTTIKAVAGKNSLYSTVSSATYTIGGTDPTPTALTLIPNTTALTGGGTVTLTVGGAAADATVSVTCTSHPGSIVVSGSGSTWLATLPNTTAAYTFTAAAEGYTSATCTVRVTRYDPPTPSNPDSGSSSGAGSSSGSKTEVTKNPDGSTTTTVTSSNGTVTETTKYTDGSREVVETKKDGTVTTTSTDASGNQTKTVENPDGSSETTIVNKDGSSSTTTVSRSGQVEAEVKLPSGVVEDAENEALALPMPSVPVTTSRSGAPAVTVDLPSGRSVKVEIPVEDVTAGTVAVLVKPDGSEEVIKTSVTTEAGVAVTLSDGDTVKIVDNSKTFYDVHGSYWGADAIDFATSRELFNGTSSTTFEPDTDTTRGMLVTILARLEGVDTSAGTTWYEAGQQWAMRSGISDGSNMEQTLTREEMATMLYRYAQSAGYDVTNMQDLSRYSDASNASTYAVEALQWATAEGLITDMGDGNLNPGGPATRAQMATILMRFLKI